jgi:hypothetical protein
VAPAGRTPDVVLDPASVLGLARKTSRTAEDVSGDRTFRDLTLDAGMLGGFASAAGVVDAHRSAHAVVAETIEGVRTDLDQFSGYLRDAVAGLEDADHLSAGALERLAAIRVGTAAEDANLRARTKYADQPRADHTATTPEGG